MKAPQERERRGDVRTEGKEKRRGNRTQREGREDKKSNGGAETSGQETRTKTKKVRS